MLTKNALSIPTLYQTLQLALGARAAHQHFIMQHVRARPGDSVLDVGCGTGISFKFLPTGIGYTGVDISQPYIKHAQAQFAPAARFFVGDASDPALSMDQQFDRIFSVGVLHHLSDEQIHNFTSNILRWLKPDGRFVSIDPCFADGQHPIARFLISHDRGEHVRTADRLFELFSRQFSGTKTIAHDMLRIPYTHVILNLSPHAAVVSACLR